LTNYKVFVKILLAILQASVLDMHTCGLFVLGDYFMKYNEKDFKTLDD